MAFCLSRLRRARESLTTTTASKAMSIDKTIIIEDSLPYGTDNMDTQIHPLMDDLADQSDEDEPVLASPPKAPVVARLILK